MNTEIPNKKFIIVEGNIGAGKSTLLKLLRDTMNIAIIPEPTDKWQRVGAADNLLDLFYKDTPRWAYTFQSYAFLTRVQAILEHRALNPEQNVYALERSVYCDRFCFAKNCYELGLMSQLEWNIYKDWFLWVVGNFTPRPSGFIYLRTDPEVSFQRLAKRNRHEESTVPLSYLQALHVKHDDWLIHKKELIDHVVDIPVLTIDANNDFENDQQEFSRHINTIKEFIGDIKVAPRQEVATTFANTQI